MNGLADARRYANGAVLVTTLVLMLLVLMLGIGVARRASQGAKVAQSAAASVTAFAAAEAALADAERDIAGPGTGAPGRQSMFDTGASAFSLQCGRGADDLGLCLAKAAPAFPDWQVIDLAQDDATTVALGTYTGARMGTGGRGVPLRLPRYLIEFLPMGGSTPGTLYRVTAIGFGDRAGTQVVLQSFYHRPAAGAPAPGGMRSGRLAWRTVANWPALHQRAIQ